jgi:hypothetical protein
MRKSRSISRTVANQAHQKGNSKHAMQQFVAGCCWRDGYDPSSAISSHPLRQAFLVPSACHGALCLLAHEPAGKDLSPEGLRPKDVALSRSLVGGNFRGVDLGRTLIFSAAYRQNLYFLMTSANRSVSKWESV